LKIINFLLIFVLSAAVTLSLSCSGEEEYIELNAKIVMPKSDITIKEGESVLFNALASGGTPPYQYVWNFGLVAPDFLGQYTPEIVFKYEGAYTVTLTVTDDRQGKATDVVKILVTREAIY
jgi:PKD repeat protein